MCGLSPSRQEKPSGIVSIPAAIMPPITSRLRGVLPFVMSAAAIRVAALADADFRQHQPARPSKASAGLGNAGISTPPDPAGSDISHRSVAAAPAAAITAVIDIEDAGAWYQGALGELHATLGAQQLPASGTPGGIYATGLFADARGQATLFIPCAGLVRPVGRVEPVTVPPAELAIIEHNGPQDGIDRAYGALATHVAEHALAVDGPIREYYLCGRHDTPDESAWRTEIGWPIFQTAP